MSRVELWPINIDSVLMSIISIMVGLRRRWVFFKLTGFFRFAAHIGISLPRTPAREREPRPIPGQGFPRQTDARKNDSEPGSSLLRRLSEPPGGPCSPP